MKRFSIIHLLIITSLTFTGQLSFAAKQKNTSSAKAKQPVEKNAFSLYPEDFSRILSDALKFAEAGNYDEALICFDDRIYNYKKETANEKTAARLELISADIQMLLREFKKTKLDFAAKKINLSIPENKNQREEYFSKLAASINKIRELGLQIQSAGSTGYPYFLSRFVLGISEEPKSGICGTLSLNFNDEIEKVLAQEWNEYIASRKTIEAALKDENIFSNAETLAKAIPETDRIKSIVENLKETNGLKKKLKAAAKSQAAEAELNSVLNAADNLCTDTRKLFNSLEGLQTELKNQHEKPADVLAGIRSEKDEYAEELAASASNLSLWSKNAAAVSKSSSIAVIMAAKNETYSFKSLAEILKSAGQKTESTCTQRAIVMWVAVADYYSETGKILYEEDEAFYNRIKGYLQGIDGIYYPSRSKKDLETLRTNIAKDKAALEGCKAKLNNGYIYRSNFIKQQEIITENANKISMLEKDFAAIEADAEGKLLKATLAKNELEMLSSRARKFNESGNFNQTISSYQSAVNSYTRLTEDLKNDGDIQSEVYENFNRLRQEIIERQQGVFGRELREIKNLARTEYYAGDFEKASGHIVQADTKRDMWTKLLDIDPTPDAELDRLRNFVNTAIAIKEGREIQSYDAKAPEMRQNLSRAQNFYEKGKKLLEEGNRSEAEKMLNRSSEKINLVKIYYPRNKTASVLALKITKILDPVAFEDLFKSKIAELKQTNFSSGTSLAQESYSSLLDLYEMNPSYPGLKGLIETAEYGLGLKQRPADKSGIEKAEKLAKEAQAILNKAGRDTIMLEQAREKANSAMELNPENSTAITVLDEIAFRTGQQSAVVLSSADENLYQGALADLQKNKIFDANAKLTQILKNSNNAKSAKIIKLKKRIEAQL